MQNLLYNDLNLLEGLRVPLWALPSAIRRIRVNKAQLIIALYIDITPGIGNLVIPTHVCTSVNELKIIHLFLPVWESFI